MKAQYRAELDRLHMEAKAKGHRLQKADVVRAAKDPKNPLHSWPGFTWDQKEGYEKNLLREAGELIQMYYVVLQGNGDPVRHRYYVSLTPDRVNGGGYRTIPDILDDDNLRTQLLTDALAELERFADKYRKLQELIGVFEAIDEVLAKNRQPSAKRTKRKVAKQATI